MLIKMKPQIPLEGNKTKVLEVNVRNDNLQPQYIKQRFLFLKCCVCVHGDDSNSKNLHLREAV